MPHLYTKPLMEAYTALYVNIYIDMKPSHRIFCPDAGRSKLRFETEKKALNFIRFNADDIEREHGYRPIRAYYCVACGCWHVTSKVGYGNPPTLSSIVVGAYDRDMSYKEKARQAKKIKVKPSDREIDRKRRRKAGF